MFRRAVSGYFPRVISHPGPTRVSLAQTPTTLVPMPAMSQELGVEILCKRDDLTGFELSGNKVRKLEFLLGEAQAARANVIITCGGEQSNHCRATAFAAARLGLGSRLLLRTANPAAPPRDSANILLDRLVGADIRWISQADWADRDRLMEEEATRLRAGGKTPYIIPEGGSNALGSWGYVRAVEELAIQLRTLPSRPTTLLYACGSGGTGAGLVLGQKLCGLEARVVGVAVCDDSGYFKEKIVAISTEFARRFAVPVKVAPGDVDILDGYVGAGYARSRPEELALIAEVARREAILLDPVYTGKAFFGLASELKRDRKRFGERVVFMHTGGAFGLFSEPERFATVLS